MESTELKALAKEIAEIKTKYYEIERVVNKEAESIRNHLEDQMKDLLQREVTVNENKEQIFNNIEHLDERSQDSVIACFEFVNK